ncbi:MAG: AAA family ATPase, partial [Patescibacteria group bacterium]|nr:AAA family ATPase [Patescibacteria group bacterium]
MIIGITGTNGSGKGTVVDYLVEKGFRHYSARDFIVAEIERRDLPVDRPHMQQMGNELRRAHGPTYIIEQLFAAAEEGGGNAVLESVREVAGAKFLKQRGAVILATDADRKLRYERIVG